KGHPIQLAVMSGSATMTRLMIEKGGDLKYTLHGGYTDISWGWLKASLTDISEEMGRSDITDILKSKKGLKSSVRNVGNLHEYFGFKPYDSGSSLKTVQGRFVRNDFTGKYEYPAICRYTGKEFSYGILKKDSETGKTVCDQRRYKADKSYYRNEPFEVLYHLKPLKKNQEIVWEVPNAKENGNEEVYKYSFQPPDEKNVLKFCAVADGFTMSGIDNVFFQTCSQDRQSYMTDTWYHFLLTLVEYDSENTAEDTKPTPELNMQLLKASYKGDADQARIALKSGADPNAQNKGWTGLMYAAYFGKTDVIRALLEYSADTTIKYQGFTALSIAEKKGNTEAAALLKPADRSLRPSILPRSNIAEPSVPGEK
ncbi:MAG TPA: ankyrin repeat domain-containing protein, partial [Leptospiraceae bacterium]|nr:ankyrin repeat domain-containing protein [Leptospiraceae bacterium]